MTAKWELFCYCFYFLLLINRYRISANSFRGNYSFLNLALFTVTFDLYFINLNSCRGNYSREERIRKKYGMWHLPTEREFSLAPLPSDETDGLTLSRETWSRKFPEPIKYLSTSLFSIKSCSVWPIIDHHKRSLLSLDILHANSYISTAVEGPTKLNCW